MNDCYEQDSTADQLDAIQVELERTRQRISAIRDELERGATVNERDDDAVRETSPTERGHSTRGQRKRKSESESNKGAGSALADLRQRLNKRRADGGSP